MKKIVIATLGFALLSSTALFAQDTMSGTSTKTEKKMKHKKGKKGDTMSSTTSTTSTSK